MISLVVGKGQIGSAVTEVIKRSDKVYTFDLKDQEMPKVKNIDILHVCFPCDDQDKFVEYVNQYIETYKPMHVVIWATVPIGTTKLIRGAVHSPVEGVHPKLSLSIKAMVRWIGANDIGEADFFVRYFRALYLIPRKVDSSDFTEALKLLSTTEYGVNIEFARYKRQVADKLDMPYELTKLWNEDYNRLYRNIGIDWAKKYVLDAPEGSKGGHCVTPNARILQGQFPDKLVEIVGEL